MVEVESVSATGLPEDVEVDTHMKQVDQHAQLGPDALASPTKAAITPIQVASRGTMMFVDLWAHTGDALAAYLDLETPGLRR